MTSANTALTIDRLRKFLPLRDMSDTQLTKLLRAVNIEKASKGQPLMKLGSKDNFSYLLLEGTIRLKADDGKIMEFDADHPSALNPIARLVPRMYDVIALTLVKYLRIDNDLIKGVASQSQSLPSYQVSGEQEGEATDFENQITFRFLQDLNQDNLRLPSLPEVAVRIGRAMENDKSDAADIARIIQSDPVITAKLIKAANSALYGGQSAVETCSSAVIRLGNKLTHKLVLTFTMQDIFKSKSRLLQQRMQELWRHSTKVAAICYVLAKRKKRFEPEHAMLAGLMHDIGVVAILDYASSFPEEVQKPHVLEQAIQRLRAQTGSMILSKWGFPTEFIVATLECEDWLRDNGGPADYCDLVIIAQLHSFVGIDMAMNIPRIHKVPALKRLDLGDLTPRLSLKILDAAEDQIAEAEALLNL